MYLGLKHTIFKISSIFTLVAALVLSTAHSATVTVDPLAAPVPGSVYNTILEAAEDHPFLGDAWANGVDDTILLTTNAQHIVVANVDLTVFGGLPQQSMTIRSAGPGPAIVVGDPLFAKDIKGVFECSRSGTYNFEGLTIIGSPTKSGAHEDEDPSGYRMNGAWKIEADSPGEQTTVNIRDCVVTANDGSNQPILDYSAPFPSDNVGVFIRGIYMNDDAFRGQSVKIDVENSVFAYAIGRDNAQGGLINALRTHDSGGFSATEEVSFKNCLFTNCRNSAGFTIGGATIENGTLTLEDCLITNVATRGLNFDLGESNDAANQWGAPWVDVIHSIIVSPGPAIANRNRQFEGTLNLDEVTMVSSATDCILLRNQTAGQGNFNLANIIAFGAASVFRLSPDATAGSGPAPASLVAQNIATDNAVRNTQAALVQTSLNNAVVTSEDPLFLDTGFDSGFAGIRAWNSPTNALFDVGNGNYAGLGTGGADLRGGAEFGGGPPPPPTSSIEDWKLYE